MSTPRTRRSSDEVRSLMLDSARALFRTKGYDATSTREISDNAGVSESMLFRHFGSKSVIFEQSVLRPFIEFVEEFVRDWAQKAPADVVPELLADTYVKGLLTLCRDNRDLLTALSATHAEALSRSLAQEAATLIQDHLTGLANQVQRYHDDVGIATSMDPQLAVRFTVSMVVGAAFLGSDFFGDAGSSLTDEMATFIVRGAGYTGGAGSAR